MGKPDDIQIGRSEIRFNEDGTIDEIVVRDSVGRCLLHIEQMSDVHYWGVNHDNDYHFTMRSKNLRSHVEIAGEK